MMPDLMVVRSKACVVDFDQFGCCAWEICFYTFSRGKKEKKKENFGSIQIMVKIYNRHNTQNMGVYGSSPSLTKGII